VTQDVVSLYRQQLDKRGFVADSSQWRAVERLQQLFEEWSAYKARRSSAIRRLIVKPPLPRGVYLWGPVGRGKSFLMDSFYLCLPLVRKRRVHFHHFMREIHREMNLLKGTEDPIAEVAARTARRYRLVCFDEFHVSDIADAMILGRYLEQVMDRGVVFCMTSNYRPDALYPNGLQRERFLPAIELIEERLNVIEVDNGTDYRRLKMERLKVYHIGTDSEFPKIFDALKDVEEERHPLDVEGRQIPYRKRAGGLGVVRFPGAVRRAALVCRLCRPGAPVPHHHAVRRAPDVAEERRCGAALHLADRRAVRRSGQPDRVRGGRARSALYGRRKQRRIPAQCEPATRDAVGAIPAGRAAHPDSSAPIGGEGRGPLLGFEHAQHRRPLEHAVRTARPGLVEMRGFLEDSLEGRVSSVRADMASTCVRQESSSWYMVLNACWMVAPQVSRP
jgi:predicted ATPase